MLRFSGAGRSDVGRVRADNEDAGYLSPYLALVADGVGGAAAGEIASATAAHAVVTAARARFPAPPRDVIEAGADAGRRGIQRGIQRRLDRLGMATTLTVLVTDGREVALGHVGDSRAYRWRDGTLERLSTDHTYVQGLVDQGRLAAEAAAQHPWRHVVLRSLDGDPADRGIDVLPVQARPGDRFLLCSDGLTDLVAESAIADLMVHEDAEDTVEGLVGAALEAGGRDNVTCVVLDVEDVEVIAGVEDGGWPVQAGRALGALADPRNVVDPAAV